MARAFGCTWKASKGAERHGSQDRKERRTETARPAQEGTVASRGRRRASSRISLLLWREGERAYARRRAHLDAVCTHGGAMYAPCQRALREAQRLKGRVQETRRT
jgi:hypothetical protein